MVSIQAFELVTYHQKSKGLLGTKKPINVFFRTRFGIHTFSMKYSIDVVILNSNNTVVAIYNSLKPNRIYMWNPAYSMVLELAEGTTKRLKIEKGTQITLSIKPLNTSF